MKSIWRALFVNCLIAAGQFSFAAESASYFEAEVSLKLMSQLEDASIRQKTGIEGIIVPKFPVVRAHSFCEAIQVAKVMLMNQPYPGQLASTDGKLLEAPELDANIDGLILKEVTANTWIRSCLMGRKWHPARRADITCDEVLERECNSN